VIESAGGGYDTVFVNFSYTIGSAVERLVAYTPGSTAALSFTGNALDNEITGNAGANVIDGGAGADTMTGGAGNDVYFVDNAGDHTIELAGGGYDTVFTSVSYTLGNEADRLVTLDPSSTAHINLTGNASANEITGSAGVNWIDGGAGADTMSGAGGDDVYFVDNAGDVVSEAPGAGYDTVFSSVSFAISSQIERLVAYDTASTTALSFTGNALANEITGNAGADVIDGGAGADLMTGLGGDDVYVVDNAGDQVVEQAGGGYDRVFSGIDYTLGANVERLIAYDASATGSLHFVGNALANEISGNAGGNWIDGGAGADVLSGFGGSDAFEFSSALGNGNIDTITDFAAGTDRIYLDHAVFGALAWGVLAAGAFQTGAAASEADDRVVYDPATGALYYDADGSGAGAAVQFAQLHDALALHASDFAVV
jgi:Ca2+-binding RTX toxin-like protein